MVSSSKYILPVPGLFLQPRETVERSTGPISPRQFAASQSTTLAWSPSQDVNKEPSLIRSWTRSVTGPLTDLPCATIMQIVHTKRMD